MVYGSGSTSYGDTASSSGAAGSRNASSSFWNNDAFDWNAFNKTASHDSLVKGIPNFFSKTRFGLTSQLKISAQFIVVAALLSVIIRMFSRVRFRTRFWWDDLCAAASVFFLLTNQTVFALIDYLGVISFSWVPKMDKQKEEQRLRNIELGLKFFMAFEVMYLISIWLVKFSMLFLYERFARHTRHVMIPLRITQGLCAATFVFCILALFLSCRPISQFWTISASGSHHCSQRTLLIYASGISNIVTDIFVLAVPVSLLLRVNLTRKQKLAVSALYIFGTFVIVASALRFVTLLLQVSVPQSIGWSQIEVSLALILACAPMSSKLLFHPLVDSKYEELVGSPRVPDTATFMAEHLKKPLPEVPKRVAERRGSEPEVDDVVRSPDQRLRVVRGESEDGRSFWQVRPVRP